MCSRFSQLSGGHPLALGASRGSVDVMSEEMLARPRTPGPDTAAAQTAAFASSLGMSNSRIPKQPP